MQVYQLLHYVRIQTLLVIHIILCVYLELSSLFSHYVEGLLHILRGECTRLYVIIGESSVYPILENLLDADLTAVLGHVGLVTYNDDRYHRLVHIIVALRVNEIIAPGSDPLIAFDISQIKDNHTAIGTSVKCVTEALKPLLAGSIPHLEWHLLTTVESHNLFHEVGADCRSLDFVNLFVLEVFDESCLSDIGVSNDHNLQKVGLPMT